MILFRFVFRSPALLPSGPGTPAIFALPDINKPIPTMERENSNRGECCAVSCMHHSVV